jgi:ubiquinone/menaquinone biosynthesis C-methylase UbiE
MFSNPMQNIEYLDVHPGQTVLDCGSGAGEYTFDVQEPLLERIEHEGHDRGFFNITTLHADIDRKDGLQKINDASINRAVLANTLFQLETPNNTFVELARVLSDGGKLLVLDWEDSHGGLGPHPHAIIHKDRARAMIEQAGFQIVKELANVGDHHYGFICQKRS